MRPLLVASVAQLVEQLTLNQLVVGSNPPRGTNLSTITVWVTIAGIGIKVQQSLASSSSLCECQAWFRKSAKEWHWIMSKSKIVPRKILVVDDEPYVCDAVRMMLAFDGHQVETAANGKDALAMFSPGKYDLVITDYAMPAMKGDEFAAAIKSRAPSQPIVLITAYAEMLKSSDNPLVGVDFIVSKPFLLENLREAVEKTTVAAIDGVKS